MTCDVQRGSHGCLCTGLKSVVLLSLVWLLSIVPVAVVASACSLVLLLVWWIVVSFVGCCFVGGVISGDSLRDTPTRSRVASTRLYFPFVSMPGLSGLGCCTCS
jgi:hypothetical protein